MKIRLSISTKIGLGFGILTLLFLLNLLLVYHTLDKNQKETSSLMTVQIPSLQKVERLHSTVVQWRLLLKNWTFEKDDSLSTDKLKLMEIIEIEVPFLEKSIQNVYHQWPNEEQILYNQIEDLLNDSLITTSKDIIKLLNTLSTQNDGSKNILPSVVTENEKIIELSDKIESKLSILLNMQQERLNVTQAIMQTRIEKARNLIIAIAILIILIAAVITFITIHLLIIPINYDKKILTQLGKGILPDEKLKERNDELGEISAAVNSLVKGLKEISNFSIEIGKGNFNWPFEPLSKDDILGNSLIKMREELRNAAIEEDKRKKEDEQRNWATQGIAKFSEILRQNNNDLDELSNNIISNIVNYLGANQGGFFIVNKGDNDEVVLELTACYAYDRKKFLEKQFKPGEGLIGRCYLERETIFLTEIPKDYIKITSGLGEANPTCLLVAPLMHNDIVYGVIELASFQIFEPYQIEFIERIASSIASTISIVKINIQTTTLLEQSRKQTEEMLTQEAILKQTIEDLRSAQDEALRREAELQKEIKNLKERLSK
jgi:CHASE3 domain sensor protein